MVEPTNGWINHCRRLDRHHETTKPRSETTLTAHESVPYLNQTALQLRRQDRNRLFDTL
ncbi:hypothetical protein H7I39_00420 [Mycobacterium doricum]|nr:hypothetical protein [Mycolicibacterium doricum]